MSSSVPEPWGKYFSKSKQAWYYHNKVTKASFFTEDNLPDGWSFVWEGTNKTYFNIITNQRVNSKNEIPQGQSQQQQQQSQLQVPLQFITTRTTTSNVDHALVLRHCLRGGWLLAIDSILPLLCGTRCLHRRIYLSVRIIQVAQFLNVAFPPIALLPAHKLVGAKSLVVGSTAVLLTTQPETSIAVSLLWPWGFSLRTQ